MKKLVKVNVIKKTLGGKSARSGCRCVQQCTSTIINNSWQNLNASTHSVVTANKALSPYSL